MGKRNKKPSLGAEDTMGIFFTGEEVKETTTFFDIESVLEPCENEIKEFDAVNCPKHYTSGKIEVIDYIEDVCGQLKDGFEGFLVGNVIKYISRQDKKNGVEDVKKLVWYSERLIKYKDGKND